MPEYGRVVALAGVYGCECAVYINGITSTDLYLSQRGLHIILKTYSTSYHVCSCIIFMIFFFTSSGVYIYTDIIYIYTLYIYIYIYIL